MILSTTRLAWVLLVAVVMYVAKMTTAQAQPTVAPGFAVDLWLTEIDGRPPRLGSIPNPAFGEGLVAASVQDGILTVLRVSEGSLAPLATKTGFPSVATVRGLEFDTTGLFGGNLFLCIDKDTDNDGFTDTTDLIEVASDGTSTHRGTFGSSSDNVRATPAIIGTGFGYQPGIYLYDSDEREGNKLIRVDTEYNPALLSPDTTPPGRTDLDVWGMAFDTTETGVYGRRLLIADGSGQNEQLSAVYELLPDLSWNELTPPTDSSIELLRDVDVSSGGFFAELAYVADKGRDAVLAVNSDGSKDVVAESFSEVESIAIDESGTSLFVSDTTGIYRIRSASVHPGPQIICRSPNHPAAEVLNWRSSVNAVRLVFNEPVKFDNSGVSVLDAAGSPVVVAVSGSNSAFMIISFERRLRNDIYTITIHDSVVSADGETRPIDGDNDGNAGGDAVFAIEHRHPLDLNRNGIVERAEIRRELMRLPRVR